MNIEIPALYKKMESNLSTNIELLQGRIKDKLVKNYDVTQDLYGLYTNEAKLKKIQATKIANNDQYVDLNLNTEEQLLVLEQLEAWYLEKGLTFPNSEWLENQRNKLTKESTT